MKISSQPLLLLQLLLPPLLLLKLLPPRLKKRSQVNIFCLIEYFIAKEEKKEEEADVDMGGLFGDDY